MGLAFALVCLAAAAIPVAILYMMYGPAAYRPVVAVPRASLATMRAQTAPVVALARHYEPEAVYAVEHAATMADISQRMSIPSKRSIDLRDASGIAARPDKSGLAIAAPPPVPRRMARGSNVPEPRANPFIDEGTPHYG